MEKEVMRTGQQFIELRVVLVDSDNRNLQMATRFSAYSTIEELLDHLEDQAQEEWEFFFSPKTSLSLKTKGNKPLYLKNRLSDIPDIEHNYDEVYPLQIIRQSVICFEQSSISQTEQGPVKSINSTLHRLIARQSINISDINKSADIPPQVRQNLIVLVNLINQYRHVDQKHSLEKSMRESLQQQNNRFKETIDKLQANELQLKMFYNKKIDQLQTQISDLRSQVEHQGDDLRQSEKQKICLELKQNNCFLNQSPFVQSEIFFRGFMAMHQRKQTEKQFSFLKQALQKNQNKTIHKVVKLYSFDSQNKTNLHSYIDGKPNFLLLAKTHKGNLIGGYSQAALQPDWAHEKSFLFSLTDEKIIHVLQSKKNKGIQYDPYFIIFGKDQLYIQNGKKVLHSELGFRGNNCFGGFSQYNYQKFLNQEGKQTKLEHYEVLQVLFNQ